MKNLLMQVTQSPLEVICSFAIAIALITFLLMPVFKGKTSRAKALSDPLDAPLIQLGPGEMLAVRGLLNGGIAIFGRAGSGKSSSSGKQLGAAIVNHKASGGLILAAKPEDVPMWKRIFEAAGRSADLFVFSPYEKLRCNFLDYEMRRGGHTRNIVQCMSIIGESADGSNTRGGERDRYWEKQEERMTFNMVEVVKRATGKVSAKDMQRFLVDAAFSREQVASHEWRKGFHCECLEAGHNAKKTRSEANDFQLAADYWLGEFPSMADKTRSSILAGVMGLLHVFNTGVVSDLVSGETNITPDDMFDRKWVIVDMSPTEWGQLGSFVCSGWKFLTQRRVLRRDTKPSDCINVIWADEAQQFVNSYDAHYIAQCRSHLGCMVFLSQSLPGYYAALGGESGKHQTQALLANFSTTIFHACCSETAEFATKKIGKRLETFFGGSTNPPIDAFDELFGNKRFTGSFSEHYENILQDNVFQNGLRTGGKSNGYACDAIIIKSGEPFSTGENWLFKTFYQG